MTEKNMHTLDLSMAAAEKDGKPFLGDMQVVRDLVGNLASDALQRLSKISDGTMTGDQAADEAIVDSKALAAVFLGQNDEYNLVSEWNKPGAIDAFVAQQAGIAEDDAEARLMTLFMLTVQDMYDAAKLMDEGESEATTKAAIDGSLEGVTNLLLGIPNADDDE